MSMIRKGSITKEYGDSERKLFQGVRAEGDTFSTQFTSTDEARKATHRVAIIERDEGKKGVTDDLETDELLEIIREKVQLRARNDGDIARKLANDMRRIIGSKATTKMKNSMAMRGVPQRVCSRAMRTQTDGRATSRRRTSS